MPKDKETAISEVAADAYVYGYPLVLMDLTRQVLTNVARPSEKAAPVNQFCNVRGFPEPTDRSVVSPNADTLYSFAFLDLTKEPVILSVPELDQRYYLMQMLDAWTNVFSAPGTRTTGCGRGDFAVVGPSSKGTLPENVKIIKSPTSMVWIIGRTQANGKEDYAAVNAIQDQYKLTPLSAWGKAYTAPGSPPPVDSSVDMQAPPVDQVPMMDANTFFSRLDALMKDNPPAAADTHALNRFAPLGIAPGKTFDLRSLSPAIARGLEEGARSGLSRIMAEARKPHGQNDQWLGVHDQGGKLRH